MRPPKKSWKKIFNLSGGEKTLSSLALVFALHHYKPTPLYFMDEIDAALDFKNVSIVACYIYVSTDLHMWCRDELHGEALLLVSGPVKVHFYKQDLFIILHCFRVSSKVWEIMHAEMFCLLLIPQNISNVSFRQP